MATIVLENVSKVYPNGFRAVDCANLEIRDREFIVLVGPSGCGKSTTLRMIAGLDDVSSGNIYIDGRRVNDLAPRDRDLAMVFQNYALYPHLTAYENMAFGLRLRKHSKSEIESRVTDAARILGISAEQLQRKPKALSGGQRQRIAVGRAIVRQPRAFLFDEPLSNLDAKTRVEMRAEISKLHDRLESTIVYVTHDQVEAMTMGDRIVVIKDGVIQQVDDPIALYDHPRNAFVANFIGSPPMNLFRGTIRRRDNDLWFVEQSRDRVDGFCIRIGDSIKGDLAAMVDRDVLLGCRPEDVILIPEGTAASATDSVRSRVEVVEPMGAETHLYLTTGIQSFIVRSQERHKTSPGDVLHVALNAGKCHFFDGTTEMAIA